MSSSDYEHVVLEALRDNAVTQQRLVHAQAKREAAQRLSQSLKRKWNEDHVDEHQGMQKKLLKAHSALTALSADMGNTTKSQVYEKSWKEATEAHDQLMRTRYSIVNAAESAKAIHDEEVAKADEALKEGLADAQLQYEKALERSRQPVNSKRQRGEEEDVWVVSDDDQPALTKKPAGTARSVGDGGGSVMSIDVVDDDASDNDEDTLTDELLSTAGQVLPGQAEMEAVFAKHLDALSEEKEYATIQALCAEIFPRDIPLEVRSQVVPALVTTFRAYAYSHGFQEDWLKNRMREDQDNIFDAWKVLSGQYAVVDDLGALKKIEEDVEYYDRDMESLHGAYPLTNLEQLLKWREEDDKDAIVLHCAKEASSVVIESFFNLVFQYEKSVNIMVEEAYEKLFAANPSAAAADDVQKFLRICFRAWGVEHDKFAPDQLITQKQKLKEKNEIYEAWTEISRLYELKKVPLPVLQAPKPASKRPRKGIDILKDVFGSFYAYLQSQHSWSNSHKVEQLMKQTGYTTNNIDDTTQKLMVLCFETDNYEALWDLFLKVMGFLRLLAPSKLTATLVFGSPSKEWPRAPLNPKNYDYTYVHESISGPRKTKQSRSVPALGAQGGSVVQDYRTESDASEAEG